MAIEIPWIRDHCLLPGEPEDSLSRIFYWLESYTLDPRQDMGDAHGVSEPPEWLPEKAPAMFPAAVRLSSNFYKLSGTFCVQTDEPRIAAQLLGAVLWNMESKGYADALAETKEADDRRRREMEAERESWRQTRIRERESLRIPKQ